MTAEVRASTSEAGWRVFIEDEAQGDARLRVREAVRAARRLVQKAGGGEVIVRSRSGAIVERQSVPGEQSTLTAAFS